MEALLARAHAGASGHLPAPVPEAARIRSLDVLRGVAVLGVLWMNMPAFAQVSSAYFNPRALGELTGANYWFWHLGQVLGQNKFFTIFSMLFGAGIVLMTGRQRASRWRTALLHYRRMLGLMLMGVAHAFLLWFGDILFSYGVCGLFLYFFRRLRPRFLIPLGILLLGLFSAHSVYRYATRDCWTAEQRAEYARRMAPSPEAIAREKNAYLGTWWDEISYRAPEVWRFYTSRGMLTLLMSGGIMLIGMGFFKLGVFSAALSRRQYLALAAPGVLLGTPALVYGTWLRGEAPAGPTLQGLLVGQVHTYASILVSLAYVAIVMLLWQNPRVRACTGALAAVGQMALTNYLMHSLICTQIFYGRGFGRIGQFDQVAQAELVAAIAVLQLALSPAWLRYFRFGPAEWAWRSMTYMKLQPILRARGPAPRLAVAPAESAV
jgi:uncharacterized protein